MGDTAMPGAAIDIGGLHKVSLVDFPGRVSAVVFLNGCNFRCPYCHNPDLAKGAAAGAVAAETLRDYLEARRGMLDGVVITGGEPTLQPGLMRFCESIRSMGYPLKLDTNGSRPEVLRDLIASRLVDYIAMDIKTDMETYATMTGHIKIAARIRASIDLIMASGVDYEFRTTCVRPLISPPVMTRIAALIKGARVYAIQKFYAKETLDPDCGSRRNDHFDDDELLNLKAIAEPMVECCVLRG
ncbi:MAG: anaerobic ribonucleoside-triphosphate reductase activating protein [Desulfosarcina sp.]|nr:anaerobic ribonucleoside-triphosphate reductase activating protein [Desulfobacterales bacterium]